MGQIQTIEITDGLSMFAGIKKAIKWLPSEDPDRCDEEIRQLHQTILTLKNAKKKYHLLNELKAVAACGLNKELKNLIEKEGLTFQALALVTRYITTLPQLAKQLYINAKDFDEDSDLEIIQRRLGPQLEVLGALIASGIDITQEWVENLCKRAPSFAALARLSLTFLERCCKGASSEDTAAVYRLVEEAESLSTQLSSVPQDIKLVEENAKMKRHHRAKLKKASEMLEKARFTPPKTSGFKKLKETIMETLELPFDFLSCLEKLGTDQILEKLSEIVYQSTYFVDLTETYDSDIEVIAKASGGRALHGVYLSKFERPQTAVRPIILVPNEVSTSAPLKGPEAKVFEFSDKDAATNLIQMIESSSVRPCLGEARIYASLRNRVASGQVRLTDTIKRAVPATVCVLQCRWVGVKAFQIEENKMEVPITARKMALLIENETSPERKKEAARSFLRRYGSHFPSGRHTLGGVFFILTEARSKVGGLGRFSLAQLAARELEKQNSVQYHGGVVEIMAGIRIKNRSDTASEAESRTDTDKATFKHVFKSMGPQATDFATFNKRLFYNSTWAVIDRGPEEAYIPTWELLTNRSELLTESARILKETWLEDEQSREEDLKKKEQMETTRRELSDIKEQLLKNVRGKKKRYRITGAEMIRERGLIKSRDDAYDTAIEFIIGDPACNFCGISKYKQNQEKFFEVTWWKASRDIEVGVETDEERVGSRGSRRKKQGKFVFFYSELHFQWKRKLSLLN